MLEEAIALDPKYPASYTMLGINHLTDASFGWAESFDNSFKAAENLAHKALSLDDSSPLAYNLLASVHLFRLEYKKAVDLYRKAVALSPNASGLHAWLGVSLLHVEGKAEESIEEFKTARRLDPFTPDWILNYSAVAYRVNGEYEKAIEILQKVIKRSPDFWLSHFELAANYGLLGRENEARAAAAEVLRIRPDFTIAKLFDHEFRDKADKERTIEVLQKAGLKLN
jgi:tetratricopeptide (TPR) repeat protein